MILIFSILIFLAVVAGVVGFVQFHGGEGARALRSRLRAIAQRTRVELPKMDVERDTRYSAIPMLDVVLRRLNLGQRLELLLYQAGMSMRVGVLLLLVASCAMGGYFMGLLLTHRLLPALLFMGVAGPIPYGFVVFRKHQRMKSFSEEFPDALDLLVSGLRAGLSFAAAMQIVAEESPEPVRTEFAVTVEEQALGLDFRESLLNLTRRVDSMDLRFFVTAVILQRETGGNLAEILENTAELIRDRFRILGDIATFTAQGKLTGAILVALPTAIGLFTFALTPEYFRPMMEAPEGRLALWGAGLMQLAGILVIRRIVNIKV
jgi:tight adherence protein B